MLAAVSAKVLNASILRAVELILGLFYAKHRCHRDVNLVHDVFREYTKVILVSHVLFLWVTG
eukprot:5438011-Amphidinium_carterae.1